MISKTKRKLERTRRHARVRTKISGTPECPRLSVFKSNSAVYAQIIDDVAQTTLCAASTVEKEIAAKVAKMSKSDAAKVVGQVIAERAKKININEVVFDRGGYIYIGRVEALADGAREAGLNF